MKKDPKSVSYNLPEYPAAFERAILEGESEMLYATNTNEETYRAYLASLEATGFKKYTEAKLAENLFATYTKDGVAVMCSYDPTDSTVRIIPDMITVLPPRAEDVNLPNKFDKTVITQYCLNNLNNNCGMSYTIRLKDGRFLLFDGGCNDHEDDIKLYNHMKSLCAEGEEPVIAAWFLSHAHGDHYDNFFALINRYPQIKVEMMVYNLPTEAVLLEPQTHEGTFAPRIEPRVFEIGAPIVYARTGQRFHFADTVVETIFVPDDYYPEKLKSSRENDHSLVFRVLSDGQVFMVLGDTERMGSALMCRRYGKWLKADIMQQAHHGFWAGSVELYQLIDPVTVLWPSPMCWYYNLYNGNRDAVSNVVILESKNVKQVLLSSTKTYDLVLPYNPTEEYRPERAINHYAKGEVISEARMQERTYLYELGWSTLDIMDLNVEVVDHAAPFIALEERDGRKGVRLHTNNYWGVNLLYPENLRGTEAFTVELELDVIRQGEGLSVWYNDTDPVTCEGRSIYTLNRSGKCALALEVDRIAGTTDVYIDGEFVETLVNDSNDEGGVHLLCQRCEVFVFDVVITAGCKHK